MGVLVDRLAALALAAGAAFAAAEAPAATIRAHERAQLDWRFAPMTDPAPTFALELRTAQRAFDLRLSDHLDLLAALDTASEAAVLGRDNRFLRGTIGGDTRTWVRLSRVGGVWSGAIYDGAELWLLDPVDAVRTQLRQPAPKSGGHVLYRFRDVALPELFDEAVPSGDPPARDYAGFAAHIAAKAAGATKQLRLTVVADTEYQSLHGANAAAVATARVNVIDGIYSAQLLVEIAIGTFAPLASNGPLTTSNGNDLLTAFQGFMNQSGQTIPRGHLSHLFSGKDFFSIDPVTGEQRSGLAGVAFIGVLCSGGSGYGVSEVRSNNQITALIVAHEMGHNFGAPHDGSGACAAQTGTFIMNPTISGSATQFSPCSVGQMADDVTRASCLVDISGLQFRNGFE